MWNRNDNVLRTYIDNFLYKIQQKYNNSKIKKVFDKLSNFLLSDIFVKISCVLLVILTIFTFYIFYGHEYIMDSNMYHIISKGIFVKNIKDFGNVNVFRVFQQELKIYKNSAFPFLFPFLMACVNYIFNIGVKSGTVINYFVLCGIYFLNFKISKKITNGILCGILLNLLLINIFDFCLELYMGFSIPLTLLFYQLIVYIFLFNDKIDIKSAILLGIVAGLNINNRFDAILPMLSILPIISFKNKKFSLKESLIYLFVFILFLLPWIVYSKYFFGKYFVSDNSRAVISTEIDHLSYYFPYELKTIFNDTINWIKNYFYKRLPLVLSDFIIILFKVLFYIFPVFCLKKNDFRDKKNLTYTYILLILPFLTLLGMCTISGFFWESRYFIPIIWFISLIVVFYETKNKLFFRYVITICLIFCFIGKVDYYFCSRDKYFEQQNNKILYNIDLLNNINKNKETILFIYPICSSFLEFKSFYLPLNLYKKNTEYFNDFINDFKFDYIVIKKEILNGVDIVNDPIDVYDKDYIYVCDRIVDPEFVTYKDTCLTSKLLKLIKENFEITVTEDENIYKVVRKNNTSKKTE